MKYKICAVIVSYNPGQIIKDCVESVLKQVDKLLIIDNASRKPTLKILFDLQKKSKKIEIIRNKNNFGIANALNIAANYAIKYNYDWLLTLDQDSKLSPVMIETMLNLYRVLPEKAQNRVAILAPNYKTIKGFAYRQKVRSKIIPAAITSGQLVKKSTFKKIGLYKDNLFIECVDNDFCLRAKKKGLFTLLVIEAMLYQRIGDNPVLKNFLGKKFVLTNHSPVRYYYIYRNSVYLYKKYFTSSFGWVLNNIGSNIKLFIKLIFYEDKKISKILMLLLGIFHGLINHYGKFEE